MKLRITLFAALLTVCILFPCQAVAEIIQIKGYHYDINKEENVATLMRYSGSSSSVKIPSSIKHENVEYIVTEIHNRAFSDLQIREQIKEVIIGDNIKIIDDNTFENCNSLKSVIIGNSVSKIGYSAFCGCAKLTSLRIPDTVETIGSFAFYDCRSLTEISIGTNVQSIGDKAFKHCISLVSFTIPSSVKIIGYEVFGGCNQLSTITCLAEKVPLTDLYAFNQINQSAIMLIVPAAGITNYKEKKPWKNFGEIKSL